MKILNKFLQLSRLAQIAILVCALHLLALLGLTTHHILSKLLRPQKSIVVRTLQPQKSVPEKLAKATQPKRLAEAPAPKKSPPKKPENKAVPPKTTEAKKSNPSTQKAPPVTKEQKMDPILGEIKESLEAISSDASLKKRPELTLPVMLEKQSSDQLTKTTNEISYTEFLIPFLQQSLDLPEHGEVKARIVIDRFGHLVECELLEVRSEANGKFLKSELPNLTFPNFSEFHITDLSQTFTITFKNKD